MQEFLRLAAKVADAAIAEPPPSFTGRVATIVALIPIATALGFAAIGFAVTGVWLRLAPEIGEGAASLVVAAILLAGCAAAVIAIYYAYRGPRRAAPAPRSLPSVNVEAIVDEASDLVRRNKSTLLIAAFVAGLLTEQNRR
ncbi:MAG TPA: hypothetical protein VMC10_22325 [Stellaceae bacterium]|nr:hypothetical protein [Stellaceae bacterium]